MWFVPALKRKGQSLTPLPNLDDRPTCSSNWRGLSENKLFIVILELAC